MTQSEQQQQFSTVRMATIEQIQSQYLPNLMSPVPCAHTLRAWFKAARIPRFKNNPTAKRGGGITYYQMAAVERFFKSRMAPAFR